MNWKKKTINLILFFIISTINVYSQEYQIDTSLIMKESYSARISNNEQLLGGSCASPDGPMLVTVAVPPNYAWLLANGYCYAIGPQKIFTMCFTFIPTSSNVSLNSGYSSTGCATISFSGFNLYTCNPACVFVGSGLNFTTLTPGQCYTWCFTGTCTGPGPGFDHVCPYYMNNAVLPIELIEFGCLSNDTNITLNWTTLSENNNWYFNTLRSNDGIIWTDIGQIPGNGNTSNISLYRFIDNFPSNGYNYYKLSQTDYNGVSVSFSPIVCEFHSIYPEVIEYYNFFGQKIETPENGLFIEIIKRENNVKYLKVLK